MRESLNLRFALWFLAGALFLGSSWFVVHAVQVRRSTGALLEQASRAEDEGNPARAERLLRLYLAQKPLDLDARVRHAFVFEKLAESRGARRKVLALFENILLSAPEHHDIRRRLAALAMESRRFGDSVTHLEALRKAFPNEADLAYRLGICQEASRKPNEAVSAFTHAIRLAPQHIDSYLRLAGLMRRELQQPEDADGVMDKMVAANPQAYRAYLARAVYRQLNGVSIGASQDITQALRLAPDESDVLAMAANLAQQQGKLDEARKFLQHGLERHPQDSRLHQNLATVEQRASQPNQALVALRKGLEKLPGDKELLWTLTDLLLDCGQLKEARESIGQLRAAGVVRANLDFLVARLHIADERWLDASRVLQRVRPFLDNAPELLLRTDLLLGACFEQLDAPDRQLDAYRRALALNALQPEAHQGTISALLKLGKLDEAIAEARQLTMLRPLPETSFLVLARLLIVQNLSIAPDQQKWDEVAINLDKAAKANPESVDVALLHAEVLAAQDKLDNARQFLVTARRLGPKRVEPCIALARLAGRQGGPTAALRLLADAERQVGDHVEFRLARLAYLAVGRSTDIARTVRPLAEGVEKFVPKERSRLLRGLGDAHYEAGNYGEAERLWRDAVTWQPDNLSLWSRLLEASLRTGAEASQSRYLDEIRRIEGPGGPLGHFGEGSRLMEMARRGNRKLLVQAHTEFAEAARQQPGWPRVALRQAELDELEVKPQQALEHYCRAIDCGERRPSVLRRTVQLLYERHNYVQVDAVLRKLQEQAPLSNDLQRMAAEISLQNLDPDQAVAQAHQAVTAESKDYRDHMWLGHMLSALGHKAEAERSFRRAIELAQQVPAPWIALVRCQISAGQRDAAEKTLHEAQAKLPAGQAALPLAHGYAAIGRMDRAEEQIQAALSTKPADPTLLAAVGLFYLHGGQPQKGVPFLRQILDPRLHAPQDTLAWARRNLAVTLVSTGGNYAQFREALAMLDENSRQHQDSPEDQRARASVLATRPGHRREAIDLYEDLRQRFSLSHLEEFSLARLYEAEHDWPRAREGMLKVVSAESNNPRYLAPYVRSLLSHGLADEAKDWLARLEQLQAASPDAIALKARMLAVRGQPADVLRLLNTYTDEKLANPREAAARMRLAALVLDELSEAPSSFAKLLSSEADKLYQRYASQANDPTSLLLYVRFLARQRRVGDALEVCERALQTHPAAAVMHAAMVVLHAGSAKQEHCLRVERWLTAALEKSPTAGMLIQLAELRALQGRYPDAEELYRRVIAHDPRNIVALNNLAYLLAFEENRGAEALDMIERAVTLAGASAELLDTRGVAFVAAGQPAAALKDLEEAISEAPTGALYFHLAWAHQQAGQLAAAATALQTAENVGLQPLHPLDREKLLQLRVALR